MANTVTLDAWYAQPVHCPFCGEAIAPVDGASCKHMLYIIGDGNFLYRSEQFDRLIGIVPGEGPCWPEFSTSEKNSLGNPHDVATRVREQLVASMEFEIRNPSDSTHIGYAALDEELCGWGIDHMSPYRARFKA